MLSNLIKITSIIFYTSIALADEGKVKVLVILPLTGEIAVLGDAGKNGINIALEKSTEIDLVLEDDGGVPRNTVSALQKQLSTSRPTVVITAASSTSKAVAAILEKEKIPQIAIATDEEISKEKNYVVNFWVTPDQEAEVLLAEARRRNYKKIAIFSTIHEGSLSIKRKFLAANDNQLDIVHDEEITPETKDFRSIITKFKSNTKTQKIDAIFCNVFFGQVGIFARQLRELGINQDLFSIELFEDKNEVKSSNGALVGQWYVQAEDAENSFQIEYQKKFPTASQFGAANGHDAILLIIEALKNGNRDSENINKYLHNVKDFHGATGTFSSTEDNRYSLPATVKIVTKDGFKRLRQRTNEDS